MRMCGLSLCRGYTLSTVSCRNLRVCRPPSAYGSVELHILGSLSNLQLLSAMNILLWAASRSVSVLDAPSSHRISQSSTWPTYASTQVCQFSDSPQDRFIAYWRGILLRVSLHESRSLILMYIQTCNTIYILLRTVNSIGSHEHLRNYGVGPVCLVFLEPLSFEAAPEEEGE